MSRSPLADTVEAEVDADEAVAVANEAEPEPDGFGAEILLQMHQVLAMPERTSNPMLKIPIRAGAQQCLH